MLPRFFSQKIELGTLYLDAAESHHAAVLRIEEGEEVSLTNGAGKVGVGRFEKSSQGQAQVQVEEVVNLARPPEIQLALGLPKSGALDEILRLGTEIGVTSFCPLKTRFSQSYSGWNGERWSQVAKEALKQCHCAWLPEIQGPIALEKWLGQLESEELWVADEWTKKGGPVSTPKFPLTLVIGSEGGFHPEELETLYAKGARSLGLGPNRLRCQTAVVVAVTRLLEKASILG